VRRPPVSVVMPFAGDASAARAALAALRSLELGPEDELILVDNGDAGVVAEPGPACDPAAPGGPMPQVQVIRATGERSPAHARNVGAQHARREWILFLDADCHPRPSLLAAYFTPPPATEVGALAGEVLPEPAARGLVARYGATRSFLSQRAHFAHPFRPRAAAANLLVRREAFSALGGFFEGLWAAEDTDFSWRLQRAGWRLELRLQAWAVHRYRTSLSELRRQWRGYAAGRAWLSRRYKGFRPRPALVQALRGRGRRAVAFSSASALPVARPPRERSARLPIRAAFLALDVLLALEELVGLTLSNRPPTVERPRQPVLAGGAGSSRGNRPPEPSVILLAESFPVAGDPLVELAGALDGVRVQAHRRPERVAPAVSVPVDYLEDDGVAERSRALIRLLWRHPLRCLLDAAGRRAGRESLWELAPAVLRLERHRSARVRSLGGTDRRSAGVRIARLAGRRLEEMTQLGEPSRRRRGRR
jgi:GT2 family glycosyltransferase